MAMIRTASQFRARMNRLEDKVRHAAAAGLDEATRHIADEVRKLAPKDTGELAATVTARPVQARGDRLTSEVVVGAGLDSPHVAAVEYGTEDMVAEPFIRPGFRRAKDEARTVVFGRIKKALR